jgi:hypothetical protein
MISHIKADMKIEVPDFFPVSSIMADEGYDCWSLLRQRLMIILHTDPDDEDMECC